MQLARQENTNDNRREGGDWEERTDKREEREGGGGGRGGAHLRTRQGGRKVWLLAFSAGTCESVGVGASVHIVLHCVEAQKCTREYLRLASVCVYLELCVIFAV